jgi:hypothetical protein
MLEVVCGWEPREAIGGALFEFSAIRRTTEPLRFIPLMEKALRYRGLYTRPHEQRDGQAWCPISGAPMATSFANSRFLVPWLAESQWALFADGADMLWLADPAELFALADDRYAVMTVKHEHVSRETIKMDGQAQTNYTRKNWSSVVLWNCTHPSNARLTQEMVNTLPGRDLHAFCWLEPEEIGELPPEWNYLVDVSPMTINPRLLHFTKGIPAMAGYDAGPWAEVWLKELAILDATRARVPISAA